MRIFSKNKDKESPTESNHRNFLEVPPIVTRNSPASTKQSSRSDSPKTPTTPLSNLKNNSNTTDSFANFDPLMPPTITAKKRSNSFTNLLRAMSPSANSMNHYNNNNNYNNNASPSRESQLNQLSTANLMTKALSPELVPVVTLLSAQAHRRYHVGVFLIFYDLNNEGQPAERVWKEQYAVLIGTQLALWNASDLQISKNKKFTSKEMTEKLFNAASKPSYINFTDAKFKILPDRENTLVVSTTMKNRYFFKFSDKKSFHMWHATFRLCTFEYSSLQEAYTGAFLSSKGAKLSDINVILADTKFQYEDWVSVRFGAGMPWKRCYAVVSQPTRKPKKKKSKDHKKNHKNDKNDLEYNDEDDEFVYPQGAYGEVIFYENEKKIGNKKYAMARIHSAISVYAIYPSSPLLIDDSTMLKIEGMVTFGKDDKDPKESDIFIMPEKHFAVAGYDTIIRFLVPMLNAFYLYGRPKRLISTKEDPNSLLFGLPTLPEIHYLQVKDLLPLMEQNVSESWSNKIWKRKIKKLLLTKLKTGYSGCGSASGYSGALISPSITSVELFKKTASPQSQPISRFVSEGLPVSFTQKTEINSTAFHNLKTPVTQTAPVNLSGSSAKSKQSLSPIKRELATSNTQTKTSPNGVTTTTTTTTTETAYAKTPLKAVKSHQKHANQPTKKLETKFYSPQKSTVPIQSPSSPYQQYKSNHSGSSIFNPEIELNSVSASQQNTATQKALTPLKNQHQVLNQHTILSNTNSLQELDIGRESETSADSIVLTQPRADPKSDFSEARKQHASMNSEFLQNSIIDSYQHLQNTGAKVDDKKTGKKGNHNLDDDEDEDKDYVIGDNGSADPLADFYNLSRTLSSYKPLTSQTAQKKMSEEKPGIEHNSRNTTRPELTHQASSTILDDFKDARDSFDFGSSNSNNADDFENGNGFEADEEKNVFDPDYYEASSILKDESVNEIINEGGPAKQGSYSATESTHLNKSPSMRDLALPKFVAEDATTAFKKSPKVNDFKSQMNGPKPDFHQPTHQDQRTPTYTNQPQFSSTNRSASPLQPMINVNTGTHPSPGPQASQGSYGNPYQKQSPSQPYMNVTPTQPYHQPQFTNNSPRNQHQFAVNQYQNTGTGTTYQQMHPQRPAPPTAMAGGPVPGPSGYGYSPNARVMNPNNGGMPVTNNFTYQHPNVGKPVPPPMQMSRPMHSPTSPHFKKPSVKPAPLKKSGPGGFAQFMPPTPTTNPYSN
ncbi:Protein SKG3 [Hanseniaspora osmophila]|uniref:Protein SKG3 n=1 Tax=Hanseniaspora osmophila TaxID=56408 RepID=A0A1E5RI95_9ASCO|nr:Protein SKG3 [Hanseniaspora osmophila]